MAQRLLGLSAGTTGGSAEIVLKEALRAAEAAGAEVELVRLDDLRPAERPRPAGARRRLVVLGAADGGRRPGRQHARSSAAPSPAGSSC